MDEHTTRAFVTAVSDVTFDRLPNRTIRRTKRLIKDLIGVAVAGQRSPKCDVVVSFAKQHYADGPASIYGDPDQLSPVGAALANGTTGHGWDFDDTYDVTPMHSSSSVIPASLAIGQYTGASGEDVIRATALGMDAHCRLARACDADLFDLGWHRTATMGTFGATIAGSVLLDLTPEEMEHAMSIAYSQTAGNTQVAYLGGVTKRFQPGHSAMAGTTAAILARDGFTGQHSPLEGPFGFYDVYERGEFDFARVFEDLGDRFFVEDLSLKPYPCCRYMHTAIDAALELRERLGITSVSSVEDVRVEVNDSAFTAVCEPDETVYSPSGIIDLQFNIPYGVMLAFDTGVPEIGDFVDEAVGRTALMEALHRVQPVRTTDFDHGAESMDQISPARVTITTTDGRRETATVTLPKGHPENPLSETEVNRKFTRCLEYGFGGEAGNDGQDIIEQFDSLESLESIDDLLVSLEQIGTPVRTPADD